MHPVSRSSRPRSLFFLALRDFKSGKSRANGSWRLADEGWAALAKGDLGEARRAADGLLATAAAHGPNDSDYGNCLHSGHILRGYVHLFDNDLEGAAVQLGAAAQTPGSPQLDSFGPDLTLAWGLLRRGRDDAVLAYLPQHRSVLDAASIGQT
jgi:hypothetical protein